MGKHIEQVRFDSAPHGPIRTESTITMMDDGREVHSVRVRHHFDFDDLGTVVVEPVPTCVESISY